MYDSHEKALSGVKILKQAGLSSRHISLLGTVSGDFDFDGEVQNAKTAVKGVGIGAIVGPIAGALTGIGVFAIPGLGFLFGAGALVGAIAGFDIGVIGGGLISALSLGGMHKEMEEKYQQELHEGKLLLLVQGDDEEIAQAKSVLEQHGMHTELDVH
jgi:hypothetical protein